MTSPRPLLRLAGAVLLLGPAGGARAEEPRPGAACEAPAPRGQGVVDAALGAMLERAHEAREAALAGRLDEARGALEATRAAAAERPPGERAHLRVHLGSSERILARGSDGADAHAATLRAAGDFSAAAEAAERAGEGRLRSYALGHWGELYEDEGRLDEALALARRALFAAQGADAPDSLYRWQWQIGRIERARGREDAALHGYREAVRTLEALRTQAGPESDVAQVGFRAQVEPVYIGLVDLLLRRAAAGAAERRQPLLAEARGTVEAWKAAELRDYFQDACLDARRKATPDDIPGTVAVYPIALPDRIELVVSAGGELSSFTAPVDRETLRSEVSRLRFHLERRTTRRYIAHAATLYDWLIRPIESVLDREQPHTLVFVPDGPLRTIPLGVLYDRESRRFLIERFPLAVAPSLTLTEPRPIDRSRVALLAAGLTEAVQGFPPLVNVEGEIAAVGASFPGQTLLDGDFEVDRFARAIRERPFGIVHIASHGEFSSDSAQSFLLAWDGRVSMDRLAELIEATQFREDDALELLTLSACQTAVDDERAALGLAGLAVRAGARSALATLWSVNDEAAADLVTEFYAQLADPEISRAKALQRAQVKLLTTPDYRHPAYWSPYLLINSWL